MVGIRDTLSGPVSSTLWVPSGFAHDRGVKNDFCNHGDFFNAHACLPTVIA